MSKKDKDKKGSGGGVTGQISPSDTISTLGSAEAGDNMAPGEQKYLAKAKMMFDHGRVRVKPGDIVILGPEDMKQGVDIAKLLRIRAIEPYTGGKDG